jgi:hypothetical protein
MSQTIANPLSPSIRGISLTLCGTSISIGIALILWTYINSHTRVVRASQPFFLYLLCVGSIVIASSIFTHTIDPSVAVSGIIEWPTDLLTIFESCVCSSHNLFRCSPSMDVPLRATPICGSFQWDGLYPFHLSKPSCIVSTV